MKLMFVNAGHDIILDPGAVNKIIGINEAEIAKDIALRVEHLLLMVGYEVKSIQSDALTWLINESNTWGADLFVSIHCNGFTDESVNGTETLYHPQSTNGKMLAQCIQLQLVETLCSKDRGIKPRTDLAVLNQTDCPAVLVEVDFITNNRVASQMKEERWLNGCASAIARGITDYIVKRRVQNV